MQVPEGVDVDSGRLGASVPDILGASVPIACQAIVDAEEAFFRELSDCVSPAHRQWTDRPA